MMTVAHKPKTSNSLGRDENLHLTAVCISRIAETLAFPMTFYCHTEGYKPILGHDNKDMVRLRYLTNRYNSAIHKALEIHPETTHILVIDSYYVNNGVSIKRLVDDYSDSDVILGGSIWYWARWLIRPRILYYDTLSVNELRDPKWHWHSENDLPKGLTPVSGVGGCWIVPRFAWEKSGGFSIPEREPQAGGSKCIATDGMKVMLDCDARFWRTPETSAPQGYSWPKRIRTSLGDLRRKII